MRLHRLERRQRVGVPLERVFPFFAEARNLESITPPWLHFRVLNPGEIVMRQGTIIDYALKLHGVPVRWQSAIEAWEPPFHFVDVQTRGPYRLWRHEHWFEPVEGGTLLRDEVTYSVRGGFLVQRLLVGPSLDRIFEYRREQVGRLFAAPVAA